jgi:hypothetical protein
MMVILDNSITGERTTAIWVREKGGDKTRPYA